MARPELQRLYQELLASNFRFIPRGQHEIAEIYAAVRAAFTRLCDDRYLCRQNCSRGHDQPEWMHVVRKALERLKSPSGAVRHVPGRGIWSFH